MATLPTAPAPDFGRVATRPKRALWKWSLVATGVILVFLLWQCGSALVQGRKLANAAVRHFHQQLNTEDYEEIYNEADDLFKAGQNHDELIRLLRAVHKKLGNAGDEKQVNVRADVNTNGTFITTWYSTAFVSGTATEMFTWVRSGGTLKLYSYHIESNGLILNEEKPAAQPNQ
jgi:deoxyribodipyrimidine photolyase-like uncharacterized protein